MAFMLEESAPQGAVIKVVGVGGGGGNAVAYMMDANLGGVDFICANTDSQALRNIKARTTIRLGEQTTKGLGAGANPEVGRQAAMEDRERIVEALKGANMVFIAAGMGGGTGTGAAPIIAEVAKDLGILTIAVVTRPFNFEGGRRNKIADDGLQELRERVDSLITIPNDKLLPVLGDVSIKDAFSAANGVLLGAVKGISDLITCPGVINVDFADVRTAMSEMGLAMMGTGRARGENRAETAARAAVSNPLMDNIDLHGARAVLVNITGSSKLGIKEFSEVGSVISEFADPNAINIMGLAVNEELEDELVVTVVATGIGQKGSQPVAVSRPTPVQGVYPPKTATGEVNWKEFDKPAHVRQPARDGKGRELANNARQAVSNGMLEDLMDIPTFLRRQAD